MRRRYVWRDGAWREDVEPEPRTKTPLVGEGDTRGYSFQLPLNYKYAENCTTKAMGAIEAGTPYWTTARKGEEIARRAQDHGDSLQWERKMSIKRPKSI